MAYKRISKTHVANCFECKHVTGKNPAFIKCGAHGGSYCSMVNGKGGCASFESTAQETPAVPNQDARTILAFTIAASLPFAIFGIIHLLIS